MILMPGIVVVVVVVEETVGVGGGGGVGISPFPLFSSPHLSFLSVSPISLSSSSLRFLPGTSFCLSFSPPPPSFLCLLLHLPPPPFLPSFLYRLSLCLNFCSSSSLHQLFSFPYLLLLLTPIPFFFICLPLLSFLSIFPTTIIASLLF